MHWSHVIAATVLLLMAPAPDAMAGKADVIAATAVREAEGTFRFDVTIRSDDTGWDKYADRWDVVAPDGTVLGTRVLLHPHEAEQPFTRDLTGVRVPDGITSVIIRAHDKVEGYGGQEMTVNLP